MIQTPILINGECAPSLRQMREMWDDCAEYWHDLTIKTALRDGCTPDQIAFLNALWNDARRREVWTPAAFHGLD